MIKIKFLLMSIAACLLSFSCQAQTSSPAMTAYDNTHIDSLICAYSIAQSRDAMPPTELQQKFNKDFPKAIDVEWEMAGNVYEVEFEIGYSDYKAFYDVKGNLLMYGFDIKVLDLPDTVKSAAKKQYPKYRFDNVKKVLKGSETFYKMELEYRESEVKIVIKQDGSVAEKWYD